ncbi:acyl-coenzyme A diphosphatase FITM2 isoform X1 [Latimeria chalumnae]|nr:PREDICTED: fat storage-inducing transmembrane protein 2 isoform X1 [Latimeria chalumnae]|eukprot:XP_006000542.1 PREDICTED: fat storage-inducing transmembrane protein 2 isoform X1 [Latimeria chalumnae]
MELIENCACVFSNMFCTTEAVRKNFQWVLVAITVAGSLIKEVQLLPDSYFNYKRNVLNVYFVKLAWGWTLCILLPFIALSNFCVSRDIKIVLKRSSTLVVGTAVWYAFTWLFFYIEDLTGSCFESATMTAVKSEYGNRAACRKSGYFWHGFDISGHSFLLSYCALMIFEEIAVTKEVKQMKSNIHPLMNNIINVLFIALNFLVIIWVWMFICTSVYFHDPLHKILGTASGVLSWYTTYKQWYLKPFSPGLPPKIRNLKEKV